MAFITPNGKELKVVVAPNTGHFKIIFTSGGELPAELQGLFTSSVYAEKHIAAYLGKKQGSSTSDGKRKAS